MPRGSIGIHIWIYKESFIIMAKTLGQLLEEAAAFAAANQHNQDAQRQWAHACTTDQREYFCTAMDARPRVQLQGIDELTMDLADEQPTLSWELRELIHVARPLWEDDDTGGEIAR
jgi:hypothetical protein